MAKIIIGLAGEIACGKGTIAKYALEKYSGTSYRFSTMLRDVLNRLYLEYSRQNLQKISMLLRQNFGEDIMAKVMFEDVKKDAADIVMIDGVRRLADIKYLRQLPEFKLVYIEADIKKRYERIIRRGENPDDNYKAFGVFKKEHEHESESQIKDLKNYADFLVNNSSSYEALYEQADKIITQV